MVVLIFQFVTQNDANFLGTGPKIRFQAFTTPQKFGKTKVNRGNHKNIQFLMMEAIFSTTNLKFQLF